MAYSAERFNENASGMTGRGAIAIYDGTGSDAEGGDTLGTIKGARFFPASRDNRATEVFDAVLLASRGDEPQPGARGGTAPHAGDSSTHSPETRSLGAGEGLPIILQGRNGTEIDMLYINAGVLTLRGGAWNHT